MSGKVNSNVSGIYNLTPLQHAMVFHKLLDDSTNSYVEQSEFTFKGNLNFQYIEESLSLLALKHDALRSVIVYEGVDDPLQVVFHERTIEFNILDISDKMDQELALKEIKKSDIERNFNLSKDSVMRLTFVKTYDDRYTAFWSFHHVYLDGWSFGLILGEFMTYYKERSEGVPFEKMKTNILDHKRNTNDFGKYMKWLEGQGKEKALKYWENLLEPCDQISEIAALESPQNMDTHIEEVSMELDIPLFHHLKELCQNYDITINTLTETAFGILIHNYCRCNNVVFGKVVSGRGIEIEGINEMVGLFVNTIPVVLSISEDTTVESLLKDMQKQSVESGNYDYCSLADIQNSSYLKSNLIKILYVFENYYVDQNSMEQEMNGIEMNLESVREQTNYDLTFAAHAGDTLRFKISYNPQIYREKEIKDILNRMVTILKNMESDSIMKVEEISLISRMEEEIILNKFNDTEEIYHNNITIPQMFERIASQIPDQTALILCDQIITYKELNEKANALAWKLREFGIGAEDYVAIVAGRRMEMIIGILGIMKAGAAYVPVDITYPAERIKFMLEDCAPKLVLSDEGEISCETRIPVWNILDKTYYDKRIDNLETVIKSDNLAYLIYTSGTTGKPKGVMIEHRSVLSLQNYLQKRYAVEHSDVVLQFANNIFDAFVWEVALSLLNGAVLCMIPENILTDITKFEEYLSEKKVSLALLPPQYYLQSKVKGLKILTTGGSAADHRVVELAVGHGGYLNAYGPTESTVLATGWYYEQGMKVPSQIPIGKPIANTKIYVMKGNHLCGIGLPGELCIAGAGLARGYLNKIELTEEKFIENPFGDGKLYRSGDLARWLPDGNLEYMGRIDEQIKIRGFRIELEEIESVIHRYEDIMEVTAIVRSDRQGDMSISAYYVANHPIDKENIRLYLQKELPEHMIPSYFMQLDHIPINRSGKVDKKALPVIEAIREHTYMAPKSDMEKIIAEIFSEILGVEEVGVHDNFFQLGGHSLRATRLVNQIEGKVGSRLQLKEVFKNPTVAQISNMIDQEGKTEKTPIPKAEYKEYYLMSSTQKRMFLMNQMEDMGVVYNIPISMKFNGKISIEKLTMAFKKLIERHEILRTRFSIVDDVPVQHIEKQAPVEIPHIKGSAKEVDKQYQTFIQPFDLEKIPLMRLSVVDISEEESILFLDMHHIISDGMSMGIVIEELSRLYNGEELEPLSVQYKDYSEWALKHDIKAQKEFWTNMYKDGIPKLNMPLDYPRPKVQTFDGKTSYISIDKNRKKSLSQFVERTGSTEYMVLLSALIILLSKYSRQDDIVVGSVISGRIHEDTEGMLGMFVNTLVLRGKPENDKKYMDFLSEIKSTCLLAYENQEFPFEELIEAVELERDLSRNPMFDVMFALQNNENKRLTLADAAVEDEIEYENTIAKFDLTVNAAAIGEEYIFGFEYCTALFKEDHIRQMMEHYVELLDQIVKNPESQICQLEMISEVEKEKVVTEFNRTEVNYDKNKTIAEIFEEIVDIRPDHTAVIFQDERISYVELNKKANRLAGKLKQFGVRANDFVALSIEKSIEMVIGMLAVIKAGGAYVPIDTEYPQARIQYMLEDCKPKVILVGKKGCLCTGDIPTMDVFDPRNYEDTCENLPLIVDRDSLAYLIYTSGTTGKPKGVMIEHHGVIALRAELHQRYQVRASDVVLQFANYIFDASVWEFTMALLHGATLCMVPEHIIEDNKRFQEYLNRNGVTIALLPPQYYMQSKITNLRILTTGGSASNTEMVRGAAQNGTYINAYGPTESTVLATCWEYAKGSKIPSPVPIGRPISNSKVYIMNEHMLCGIGIPGELCITGDTLARGYLNQAELTNEKFTDNPFGEGKMYRSGDLVRWMSDGTIEFMGRIDEQVKVRGYRIELGEVEYTLRSQKEITDAVAIIREDDHGNPSIYAYFVSEMDLEIEDLRHAMTQMLPDYMIPSYFMRIESIPVNLSGKVDKKALPDMILKSNNEFVAPRDEKEKILVDVFCAVLGVDHVSIEDNFFEFGGDSIKAILIVSKMRERNLELTVKDIMRCKTIKGISKQIKSADIGQYSQEEVTGVLDMIPIQTEFFHHWNMKKQNHFNQSMMLKCDFFDRETLHAVLNKMVCHHDMLRAVYYNDTLEILSTRRSRLYDFEEIDARKVSLDELDEFVGRKCTNIQEQINLKDGPIVKAAIILTREEEHLFLCIHHIAVDGVSWRILTEDINKGYEQYQREKKIELPLKTSSFKEWAEGIQEYASTNQLLKEKPYWMEIESKLDDANLRGDRNEELVFKELCFTIDQKTTEGILFDVGKQYNSEINDILLTALLMAAYWSTGQRLLSINLENHGREELHKKINISRTVGWFTSCYPLILESNDNLENSLLLTKENIRRVPNKGIGYGILKDHFEAVDVSFNYLGQIERMNGAETTEEDHKIVNSELPTGENISQDNLVPGNFILNATVVDHELTLVILYNGGKYSENFVVSFIDHYKRALYEIVALASVRQEVVFTLSDVDALDIDMDELQEINSLVTGIDDFSSIS